MLDKDKLKMIKDAIDIQYVDAEKVNVEEYGVITGTIYGSRRKDFVRIKSDVFQSLFKELKDNKNCSFQNIFGQAQPSGNSKSVGFSGNADQ